MVRKLTTTIPPLAGPNPQGLNIKNNTVKTVKLEKINGATFKILKHQLIHILMTSGFYLMEIKTKVSFLLTVPEEEVLMIFILLRNHQSFMLCKERLKM